MIEIAVKYLEQVTEARLWTGDANRVCKGVVIDSREVGKDSLFVAFEGEHADGNRFAPDAIRSGAAAVVLTHEPAHDLIKLADQHQCSIFSCDDPQEFLLLLAQDYRARMGCTVVAITGSIGKTTTKDVLAALLKTRYRVHATAGNLNSLIGMPLTILAAPRDTEVMVLEMGMDAPGQIERLSRSAQPTYGIITKIGTSHVGLLGGREAIAKAKAEIVAGMPPSSERVEGHHSRLFLSGEDDFTPFIIEHAARPAGIDVHLFGLASDDDISAAHIQLDVEGHPSFAITFPDGTSFKTTLSLTGRQAVLNALAAAGVARELGIACSEIGTTFEQLSVTGRRQEMRRARSGARIIDDSYNASPESMAAGLDLLAALSCEGMRVAILGEMGELGDEAARLHGLTGAYAAAIRPDLLICVGGEYAHAMAASARLMGMSAAAVVEVDSVEQLSARYTEAFESNDLLLVKASRFVGLDRFVEGACA
ncbi:UDP-N-acetylmuramoyl-tripeptide--D-alanyl-D-alanine ligase [Collinsella sp. AGMB00827]|uniref:UDP-N-acetylmuramoyl-tripeptide--D-alanyl-D-alanine ligase n=1 Tax=Collinsella ureilytica TaxID=2869515 RepID=A0ABS7MHV5_9ACTN|nr:UDP-N-acetylmuramoyl-tripeptide--D-alanyl-D-alanine ligase [Collinsella urealyticum]MBY4796938.1 UDP-N-acetylmuramoyl-tripeptide--D-alanyl-D-alanine ligase [Collinsella urealyticum]